VAPTLHLYVIIPRLELTRASFKVFDYTRAQRRSYYQPANNAQTTSSGTTGTTGTTGTSATAVSSGGLGEPAKHLVAAGQPGRSSVSPGPGVVGLGVSSRPATPSDRTGVISRTGLDVEAQILDGGGMANMGGRGGWRQSEIDPLGRESVEMRSTATASTGNQNPSPLRQPTPLRTSST
jgi:serine/threonine kinase 32